MELVQLVLEEAEESGGVDGGGRCVWVVLRGLVA